MADRLATYKDFTGLNNRDDPLRLPPTALVKAGNVDMDNRRVKRRKGYALKVAGKIHSLFSDGDTCLYVEGDALKQLSTTYAAVTLRAGLTVGRPMAYCAVDGTIYYSNGVEIGYVRKGAPYAFADPGMAFKSAPPPGQALEYYKGRLYIAQGAVLWFTDALALNRVDRRRNFLLFATPITLLMAVRNGLYVSDEEGTYFLPGDRSEAFTRIPVFPYPAIRGTAVRVDPNWIGKDGMSGGAILWASTRGICLGLDGGQGKNLTERQYQMPQAAAGSGLFDPNGRYVTVLH